MVHRRRVENDGATIAGRATIGNPGFSWHDFAGDKNPTFALGGVGTPSTQEFLSLLRGRTPFPQSFGGFHKIDSPPQSEVRMNLSNHAYYTDPGVPVQETPAHLLLNNKNNVNNNNISPTLNNVNNVKKHYLNVKKTVNVKHL